MYDVIVIGAGVIGASIARELSRYELDIAVLEAASDVATGSSGANSGIVHAGYDCKPGTMMARLNVAGNALYDTVKEELDVPFKRTGSLVLAFVDGDLEKLNHLLNQGIRNGVPGLEIISREKALEMEPNLNPRIKGALWAPTAGITCPYELAVAMMENAVENGAEIYLKHPVTSIYRDRRGIFCIETPKGNFSARYVINCAGVYSDEISRMLGDESFTVKPRKGQYWIYDRKLGNTVNRIIFQPPGQMGKGVLVAPTIDGNLLIGPSAEDVQRKDDTATTSSGLEFVYKTALKSVPSLPEWGVIRVFAGLRAISAAGDFIIKASGRVEGLIHAAGICSPGLSAAPAIGQEVACILKKMTSLKKKEIFSRYRKGIPRFREMSWEQREKRIKDNPLYGRIVCRCELVTEGEIVEALRRKPPALTLDAVKRRTRAGMGRCQGGFCTPRVMEIMERELGIHMDKITKRGGNSQILIGKIKSGKKEGARR